MDVTTIKNNFDYNKIKPISIVFEDIYNSFYNFWFVLLNIYFITYNIFNKNSFFFYSGLISEIFDLEPKIPYPNPNEAPTLQDIYHKMQNITIFIRNIRELINRYLI